MLLYLNVMANDLIHILDDQVIDQIAAGEVIERPASVAKELIENSIDAGANLVHLDLQKGGLARISVTDDGCGMSLRDAVLAIKRHATSKLRCVEDLETIGTLGFRGEALSSVAAVSCLRLITRRPNDTSGTSVECRNEQIMTCEQVGCPIGTTVWVQDLFHNTPARRKFLRSPATEQARIVEMATRIILGRERVGLSISTEHGRLVDIPADADGLIRARAALGKRINVVYPLYKQMLGISISGWLTDPKQARQNARGLWIYVNGRFVRDRMLQRAILQGYGDNIQRGTTPLALIYIALPLSEVDVNVHPQKIEVRFRNSEAVFRAVSSSLNQALADVLSPGIHKTGQVVFGKYPARHDPHIQDNEPDDLPHLVTTGLEAQNTSPTAFNIRGTIWTRYLILENSEQLIFIDQRNAWQRLLYQQLQQEESIGLPERLFFPGVFQVGQPADSFLNTFQAQMASQGFMLQPVAPRHWALVAVPKPLIFEHNEGLVQIIEEWLQQQSEVMTLSLESWSQLWQSCAAYAAENKLRSSPGQEQELVNSLEQAGLFFDNKIDVNIGWCLTKVQFEQYFGKKS